MAENNSASRQPTAPKTENNASSGNRNNYNRNGNNRRRRNYGNGNGGGDGRRRNDEGGEKRTVRENREGQQPRENRDGRAKQPYRNDNGGNSNRRRRDNRAPREDKPIRVIKKREETVDDIRSDNARITKEIYLEIASMKNVNLS